MSKYIDADLHVEMQIYDDEHEEWKWWKGTIEELLDQWTEQGCPTPIEVSEDCISRKWLVDNAEFISQYDKNMWVVPLSKLADAPSVVPSRAEGEWIVSADGDSICSVCGESEEWFIYGTENWYGKGDSKYCPDCGAKMRGAKKWNNVQNVEDI